MDRTGANLITLNGIIDGLMSYSRHKYVQGLISMADMPCFF